LYEAPHGIAASVFLACFIIELPFTIWAVVRQGPHFIHNVLFCLARMGACIAGILVAEMNILGDPASINVNTITAEIVLTTIGTFWLYAMAVGVYYLVCLDLAFDQTPLADKIHRAQNVLFLAMIALIIAAAALTSFPHSSTVVALRKAYSFLYLFGTLFVTGQYIRLWIKRTPTQEKLFVWASVALIIVILKSIYILAASFANSIASYNYLIPIGWYVGANLLPDFLASAIFTIGGLHAPTRAKGTRRAARSNPFGELRDLRSGIRSKVFGAGGSDAQYQSDIQYR